MSKILVNQIQCNNCGDLIFSAHRHDFKYCQCEQSAVDGGMDYLRRTGSGYKELSIVVEDEAFEAMKEALQWCADNGRNDLGRICHMARYLRNAGYEIRKIENENT